MAIEHSSGILDPKVLAQALAQIGYFDDTTKRGRQVDYRSLLAWFVELSRKNLATLRPPELRLLHEEVRALQQEGSDAVTQYQMEADTAAQLPKTQATVAAYLKQLTTRGRIEFEVFELSASILLPRFRPGVGAKSGYKHTIYVGESVDPLHGKGMLYLFFLALKGAGDQLRQCPHCTTLFVQVRRKQRWCTRACQQVASMRDLRARRQKEQEEKTKRQRDAQPKSPREKKGGLHGPKTRR